MIGGSTEGIAGPIGIAKMSGAAASAGFGALLLFTAVLSLNIGLLNLLPIPILDGDCLSRSLQNRSSDTKCHKRPATISRRWDYP